MTHLYTMRDAQVVIVKKKTYTFYALFSNWISETILKVGGCVGEQFIYYLHPCFVQHHLKGVLKYIWYEITHVGVRRKFIYYLYTLTRHPHQSITFLFHSFARGCRRIPVLISSCSYDNSLRKKP